MKAIAAPHVHISMANAKMGHIPSVSLSPITSCPKHAPCKKDCYACRMSRYPTVAQSWASNLHEARHNRDSYFAEIAAFFVMFRPSFFRWHVAGDILDQDYLERMADLARRYPDTRFLCFTKMHGLTYYHLPRNLVVVFSMWPGWGDTVKHMPRAWMQDGTETRVPADAIHCPGNCETCGMCWTLPQLGRDVVFNKH